MARYGYRPCALVNASVPAPCSSCGAPLAADQRYCVACGIKRQPPESPVASAAAAEVAVPAAVPGVPEATASASSARGKGTASEPVSAARARSRRFEERFGWLPAPQPAAAAVLTTLACGVLIGNTVDTSAGAIIGPPPSIVSMERPSTDAAVKDEAAPEEDAGDDLAPAPPPALAAGGSAAADLPPAAAGAGDSLAAPSGGSGGLGPSVKSSSSPGPTGDDDDAGAQDGPPKPDVTFSGTVVHVAPAAQSYTVTTEKTDKLISVHARLLPKVGQSVTVEGDSLLNGTITEITAKVEGEGERKKAEFDGTVTFVDEAERTYAISDRGVSMLVRVPVPSPDGRPQGEPERSNASDIPPLGAKAKVGVRIDLVGDKGKDVELRQTRLIILEKEKDDPEPIEKKPVRAFVTGIVRKIRKEEREVTISADDRGESERNIVLKLPKPLDLSVFRLRKVFLFAVKISRDGVYTVEGASNNSNRRVADEKASTQGDLQLPGAQACERAKGSGLAALAARGRCEDAKDAGRR